MSKGIHHESADGVELFFAQLDVEKFVEILNRGLRTNEILLGVYASDILPSSTSVSSSISPTISSSTSSIVTRPATPPYSSITMAM